MGFSSVPDEFKKATEKGGVLTLGGVLFAFIIIVMEVQSLFTQQLVSSLVLDSEANSTAVLRYDITMHNLNCKYLNVQINDAFGTQHQEAASLWTRYTDLDENGRDLNEAPKNKEEKDEEVAAAEKAKADAAAKEMDADWASSSDGFQHRSFDKMIAFHDFHFVNFFAGWCHHCRHFSPTWKKFAAELDMKPIFQDRNGKPAFVKLIKVNCVDFEQACHSQRVAAYPTIRFYTKDANWVEYDNSRSPEDMRKFLEGEILKVVATEDGLTVAGGSLNTMKARGCRVRGDYNVPRVPGEFHLMATGKGSTALDPRRTNVSHTVTKLNFVGYDEKTGLKARIFNVRQNMKKWFPEIREKLWTQMAPLDGRSFPMVKEGHSMQHYMRVVMNRWVDGELFFTFASADRAAEAKAHDFDWYFEMNDEDAAVPQAKFFFDIDPITVQYTIMKKTFAEVLASIVSLLGALFLFLRTADVLSDVTVSATKKFILKERRSGGHLD
jgi:thiol-disulfide isomerase/thioredoxin